jgi:flagellar basal body rod protein FlgG
MDSSSTTIDPRGGSRALAFAIRGLEQRFEVAASNLANLETSGHKRLIARSTRYSADSFATEMERAQQQGTPTVARDFSQGELIPDDDPSELALQGDGFFAVEKGGELAYSRSVRVAVDPEGTLVEAHGGRLVGDAGPLRLAGPLSKFQVERDGVVKGEDGVEVGKLRVVAFVDPQSLQPIDGNLFKAPDGAELVGAQSTQVIQGSRERSNSEAVNELIELIVVQRQYQAAQHALLAESEIRQHLNEST